MCTICVWLWIPRWEDGGTTQQQGVHYTRDMISRSGTVVDRRESATDPPPSDSPATFPEEPLNSTAPQLRIVARTFARVSQPRRGRQWRSHYPKRRQARTNAR